MSGDLINRNALIDAIEKRYNEKKSIVPDNSAEGFVQMENLIKEQPTTFDLESAIEQLEEKIKIEHRKQPNCDEDGFGDGEEIYDDGITQGRYEAFKEALEILKSAVNGKNGKIGG